jgi:hypothetical protein
VCSTGYHNPVCLENQTLPAERLQLSSGVKDAIVAVLKTLTDTSFNMDT